MGRVHLKPDGQIVFLPDGAGVALKAGLIRVHLLKSLLKNLGIPARIGLGGDWRVGWAHPGRVSG
ncbi:MAG: hypothetical protein DCC46_08785 [Armatimonadetes bacterium]|nr:MAG: hypothetical protein DCC46_08785 [Armatimonadota bacterium]